MSYQSIINEIQQAQAGRERDMYPKIRDLFMQILGFKSEDILVDSASEESSGIPDLIIKAPTGLLLKNGRQEKTEWLVCEVKDEKSAFLDTRTREKIFIEKSKYIGIGTEFFVMIDPSCMIIRRVSNSDISFDPNNDTVIEWSITPETNFRQKTLEISFTNAGVSQSLKDFRRGDISKIGIIKLQADPNKTPKRERARVERSRNLFFQALSKSTERLQLACLTALTALSSDINAINDMLLEFGNKYNGYEVSFTPLRLKGNRYTFENQREHDKEVSKIKNRLLKNPSVSRLTLEWLPEFQARIGKNATNELFAIETANLILARILLLRFFEDHGFFGDKKYICNGGVEAFQKMMDYFDASYTRLLKEAYEKASHIYAAVFNEMELDWVFGSNNEQLSRSIEMAMMYLSRFDFSTVRGDILTGIYDRFLDKSQRKKLGEYYTPPSVARFIVDRIGIQSGDTILDPSCGSGTFLIEAYEKMAGEDVDRGLADYNDAMTALSGISGIDINPFSAVIAQIQLLWHLLALKDQIKEDGFPEIKIAEKFNSLQIPGFDHIGSLFNEINITPHDAVIGNPPYVRPERSNQELDQVSCGYYDREISHKINLYALFIYRALDGWLKPGGKLGFVVPLSFCDNDECASLRALFKINNRFTITEIVDMEAVSPFIFDAAVNPIILFAENRPATEDDVVVVRIAGNECIVNPSARQFDLSQSTVTTFQYSEIFSIDGRILTKLTATRKKIIDKILQNNFLGDIAQTFWIKKKGSAIIAWQTEQPNEQNGDRWEPANMLRRGAVFRNKKRQAQSGSGFDIYKGENISAGLIEGAPVDIDIDVDYMSDSSLWRFRDILPTSGIAMLQISKGLTAVKFDPRQMVFLDTATLFFPFDRYAKFPFDLLMLSKVYNFYYALYLRMGVVEDGWAHLYPRNMKMLPWNNELMGYSEIIEALRDEYYDGCKAIYNRSDYLAHHLKEIGSISFKDACLSATDVRINWQGALLTEKDSITIYSGVPSLVDSFWRVPLSDNLFDALEINNAELAQRFAIGLSIYDGVSLSKKEIRYLPIPENTEAFAKMTTIQTDYDANTGAFTINKTIEKIDNIVGAVFGLTTAEIDFIRMEMTSDPLLKKILPNLPFAGRKKRGLLGGLDSATRYN
jgi:type I restriction-modification system DNA methylase subunit